MNPTPSPNPAVDPNAPVDPDAPPTTPAVDPVTGEPIDPVTGEPVDPNAPDRDPDETEGQRYDGGPIPAA